MGCFLGCFRIKDDGSRGCHLFSKYFPLKKRELIVSGNRCASVVSSEEKGTPSEKEEQEIFQENFEGNDSIELELRQEAKFLKTCGAILETPVEISKASDQHFIVSDACCRKINMDQQLDKKSDLPSNVPETLTFPEDKCRSCRIEEYDYTTRKAVQFDEGKDSIVENGLVDSVALDISPQMDNQMQPSGCKSPYPTPLNLIAGMQTPGTIYPPKSETFRTGQIKVQFVYPVSDLPQNSFESKALCENRENRQKVPPASLNKEASWWLKPPPTWDEPETIMGARKEQSHSDSSTAVDRPIIGAAAAHWNGEELSHVSPKQWDGNGIPNSTTKYKEDQRVSWHATPFEVRLEKALSDEKVYPHRKLDGRLMEVEDEDRE